MQCVYKDAGCNTRCPLTHIGSTILALTTAIFNVQAHFIGHTVDYLSSQLFSSDSFVKMKKFDNRSWILLSLS